uniref:MECOM protein n=1 Tax=Heterorhabditis bacteriophora TaxID=37862 RepID=A0A1I7X419_HETBA
MNSSRYNSEHDSRCGDSTSRNEDSSSRCRDSATKYTNPVGNQYRAPNYVSKYMNGYGLRSESRMDDEHVSPQVGESQKPEIEELHYNNGDIASQEVLQESELDEFCQDTSTDEKETENNGLAIEVEQITPEPVEDVILIS